MAEQNAGLVTLVQLGDAIKRCSDAHPEYAEQKRLHPDAELLCEALAEMNWRKITEVERSVFQGDHLDALKRWIE